MSLHRQINEQNLSIKIGEWAVSTIRIKIHKILGTIYNHPPDHIINE